MKKVRILNYKLFPQATAQVSTDSMVQAMSQVSLRDLEIIGLKNENNNLENLALKREEETKT